MATAESGREVKPISTTDASELELQEAAELLAEQEAHRQGHAVDELHLYREVQGDPWELGDPMELTELADYKALFDLQQERMKEATALWRAEDPDGRALILPDLGDLLDWLMNRANNAEGQVEEMRVSLRDPVLRERVDALLGHVGDQCGQYHGHSPCPFILDLRTSLAKS